MSCICAVEEPANNVTLIDVAFAVGSLNVWALPVTGILVAIGTIYLCIAVPNEVKKSLCKVTRKKVAQYPNTEFELKSCAKHLLELLNKRQLISKRLI